MRNAVAFVLASHVKMGEPHDHRYKSDILLEYGHVQRLKLYDWAG